MKRRPADIPPPVPEGLAHDWRILGRLLPHLWPAGEPALRRRMIWAGLLLVAAKVATVATPVFFKHAIDALSHPDASLAGWAAVPVGLILAYGLARIGSQAFNELRDLVFARVVERAIHVIGLRTFRHLHGLSLRFHLERQTGGLSRAIERGTRAIDVILRLFAFRAGPSLLELAMVCAVLGALYDPVFALTIAGTIGVYILWTLGLTEWRMGFRRTMNQFDAEANTKAIDSLLNYETVKYFGNEEHEARRFDRALAAYEDAAVRSHVSLSTLNMGQGVIITGGLIVVMLMAGQRIVQGEMSAGDFVLVNTYLIQLYQPLNFLGVVYREIKQALIDIAVLFALGDTPPEVADRPGAPALRVGRGHVRFEAVSFAYAPDRPILTDVTLDIPPGGTLALVGASGAGKSTLGRLLFRFYDPTAGRVLIDDQDLRAVTQDSLRRAIGIVPQDTVLFNDTIGYNIAYGRPGATQAEIEEAARLAAIHDFVASLKDGYDTRVGERGLKLSGGEKQRVAIARTILKNPALLLFDEATSQLDSATEKEIQAALRQVRTGRTTLIIAHRLSTIVDADQIAVIDAGRVIEQGTHHDLLRRQGAYATLWTHQLQGSFPEETNGGARST
ncbi:ABCB family ABC transporter ATP-binding protein/permease [Pararhodospirillum oryzae]|uniref:Metal ABC transporter permease n=1 Tax=Pararhodospirillum oryzae TaxID=478448 RepID=A0A512H655_9PROT|nr:ABC transporter ATP-binding protein/permease [Pararhodospirillum oryzae]GEO80870.1 metal ABC transporter permease [Pararhodospirillum oryzae]